MFSLGYSELNMLLRNNSTSPVHAVVVSLRCPKCMHIGNFSPIGQDFVMFRGDVKSTPTIADQFEVGHRECPNPECRLHVFVVLQSGKVAVSYPPERITFDVSKVPDRVVEALQEAIGCHACDCFNAAAMMVRKCLEAMCEDRGSTGSNLFQRIQSLKGKVILPTDLFNGLDELRLLGNDAAHIESKDYDNIGKEEVELAIEFTKEVLKALYQYADLRARLQALKRPKP
jgi:hypothetical protein